MKRYNISPVSACLLLTSVNSHAYENISYQTILNLACNLNDGTCFVLSNTSESGSTLGPNST